MEQHASSIRAEVLRQLIGVSGGWFVLPFSYMSLWWMVR